MCNVNNKDTRMMPGVVLVSLLLTLKHFATCSSVSIVNVDQVNASLKALNNGPGSEWVRLKNEFSSVFAGSLICGRKITKKEIERWARYFEHKFWPSEIVFVKVWVIVVKVVFEHLTL